jgi:hypothetical protein
MIQRQVQTIRRMQFAGQRELAFQAGSELKYLPDGRLGWEKRKKQAAAPRAGRRGSF